MNTKGIVAKGISPDDLAAAYETVLWYVVHSQHVQVRIRLNGKGRVHQTWLREEKDGTWRMCAPRCGRPVSSRPLISDDPVDCKACLKSTRTPK
jgi:hypothetical protein